MVVGVLGVVTSCVLCARVSRVLGDVKTTGRISCATDNTYTPAHNVSTNFSAGFGCSFQLVILFEISSDFSC